MKDNKKRVLNFSQVFFPPLHLIPLNNLNTYQPYIYVVQQDTQCGLNE